MALLGVLEASLLEASSSSRKEETSNAQSGLGFAEVGGNAVNMEDHAAATVSEDCVWVSGAVVE